MPGTRGYVDLVADSNTVFLRSTASPNTRILRFDLVGSPFYDVDTGFPDGKFIRYSPAASGVLALDTNGSQIETFQGGNGSPLSTSPDLTNASGQIIKLTDFHLDNSGNILCLSVNTKELLRYGGSYNLLWTAAGLIQPQSLAPYGPNETAVLYESSSKNPRLRRYQWTNGVVSEEITNLGLMSSGTAFAPTQTIFPKQMKSDGTRLYFSILYESQGLSLFRWDGSNSLPVHLSPEAGTFHGFTFTLKGDLLILRTNGDFGGSVLVYEKK